VLRKFERLAVVVELRIGGRVIGTTGELQAGDEVRPITPG
jgi:hypothetical protein